MVSLGLGKPLCKELPCAHGSGHKLTTEVDA